MRARACINEYIFRKKKKKTNNNNNKCINRVYYVARNIYTQYICMNKSIFDHCRCDVKGREYIRTSKGIYYILLWRCKRVVIQFKIKNNNNNYRGHALLLLQRHNIINGKRIMCIYILEKKKIDILYEYFNGQNVK